MVHHGGLKNYCHDEESCSAIARDYQNLHIDRNGWEDIGYNFLIGEDGHVYEGRGWDKVGAHAPGYNFQSIGVCFMGDFNGWFFFLFISNNYIVNETKIFMILIYL